MTEKSQYKVKHEQIYDSSNRMHALKMLFEQMNLSVDDMHLLGFLVMGNTSGKEPSLPDILKKIKLPRVQISDYDRKKMLKWIDLIKAELKALDNYGILDMDAQKLIKASKNGKYMTTLGMRIDPIVYRSVITILEKSPNYALEVILGIGEFVKILSSFLKIELPDEETEKPNIESKRS